MKVEIIGKLTAIDSKKLFKSLTILAFVLICITVPLDKYVINKDNPRKGLEAKQSAAKASKDSFSRAKAEYLILVPDPPTNSDAADKQQETKQIAATPVSSTATPTSSTVDYKTIFQKDLFIGDSITAGLSFYGYVYDENTVSKLGLTLVKAQNELAQVESLKPENIYIMFGANDIDGVLPDERFTNNYALLIAKIKTKSPNSNIYIQSILPVSQELAKKRPHLNETHINELNSALEKMATKEGAHYINVASVVADSGQAIYEPDGIHFKSKFCPLWLDYLRTNIK